MSTTPATSTASVSDAPTFDLSKVNFDGFDDLSDMPADIQSCMCSSRTSSSEIPPEVYLVAALVNKVPGKKAINVIKTLILVRRYKGLNSDVKLKATTVRNWLLRAVQLGLIAKATGRSGFCAVDSPYKATDAELTARKARAAEARITRSEHAKEAMKSAQAKADASATAASTPAACTSAPAATATAAKASAPATGTSAAAAAAPAATAAKAVDPLTALGL